MCNVPDPPLSAGPGAINAAELSYTLDAEDVATRPLLHRSFISDP